VFGTLRDGLGGLVDALVTAAEVRPRLGLPVRGLARTADGWRLSLGNANHPELVDASAVVLAVPAPALRRLLADPLPAASAAAGRVEVASCAVVGLAIPVAAAQRLPQSSGVLVAAHEQRLIKAFTFSGRKWAHASSREVMLVRASLGRYGEARVLQRDDAELVEVVRADLAALTGITATPVDTVVARWGGGLPQYAPGHLGAIAAVEKEVAEAPGLAVAGAMLHGVGVPACIGTAEAAALRIAAYLGAGARAVGR
jgi:oxygen-dependent protoporphyrinogen oxidase